MIRHRAAWYAEQRRQLRERRAYWMGIGECALAMVAFSNLAVFALAVVSK